MLFIYVNCFGDEVVSSEGVSTASGGVSKGFKVCAVQLR